MKPTTYIQNFAAGFSLLALAIGFSLLGYLSLWQEFHNSLTNSGSMETGVCIAAGVASLAVGQIFLVAALLYWRWYLKKIIATGR